MSHKGEQDRRTPLTLFNELNSEFNFELDPCTSSSKHGNLGTPYYFTKEMDGLSQDWTKYKSIFINPPFNKMPLWVSKSLETCAASDAIIVLLFPMKTDTKWFHTLLGASHLHEIRFVQGRVTFEGHANPFIIGIGLAVLKRQLPPNTQP